MNKTRKVKHYKQYRCAFCGNLYRAKDRNYKPTCSTDCAFARQIESWEAMQTKQGPIYDKWLSRWKAGCAHRRVT